MYHITIKELLDGYFDFINKRYASNQLSYNGYKGYRTRYRLITTYFAKDDFYLKPYTDLRVPQLELFALHMDSHFCDGYRVLCLKFIKQAYRWAVHFEKTTANPVATFKIKGEERKPIQAITKAQLQDIANLQLPIKRLDRVRDLFLFQCYTGMSYCDTQLLTANCVRYDGAGTGWLSNPRKKSGIPAIIPLRPEAVLIIEKYRFKLPRISNSKYNRYLKDIKDGLKSHMARRTCGMLLLEAGVSLDVTSRVLGHSSVVTTERYYAQVQQARVFKEFQQFKLIA